LAPPPTFDEMTPIPPTTPRWGIGDAAVGWLIAQVGGIITGSIVLAASGGTEFDDLSLGWIAAGQVGLWLGFFGVPWVATRLKGNGMVTDLGLRAKADDLLWIPVGVIAQFAIQILISLPILLLFDLDSEDLEGPARELTDRATDPFGVVMLVLVVGIGAPIFEEIFYRGLMQRAVERRFGPTLAIAVTSVVFGLSHFQPIQAPGLVAFGALVGVVAYRTGRLGPAILTHVGFNMTTVVLLLAVDP
jgi:membrane protease YdiL (CAAX protease family)